MSSTNQSSADEVLRSDLDFLTEQLTLEFQTLSGHRLMIAGGAGFLGYYLVQGALHWNTRNQKSPPIQVMVLDNFVRGVPAWLSALKNNPHLRLIKHDITQPLPTELGDQDYLVHAASIASPIYYRKCPIETMDANVNGLRFLLDYALRQKEQG